MTEPRQPDFIRVSSPGQSSVDITCRQCGSVVPDSGTIQQAHLDWHEALGEVIEAVRVLSALGPSITPLSMLGGPTRAEYEALGRVARRACPSCNHREHGTIRCEVADGGDNAQPNTCGCIEIR